MSTIAAFVYVPTLEEVGTDRYRAGSLSSTRGVVFGGQLLAQSVMAGLARQFLAFTAVAYQVAEYFRGAQVKLFGPEHIP